jgi:competence protein ComGC
MFDRSQRPPLAARADETADGPTWQGRADVAGRSLVETMWIALIVAVAVVIAVPTFMKSAARTDDVDAKANLRLALVSAKSSYEVNQSYDYDGGPLSTLSFAAQNPQFTWTTGSCEGKAPGCVSEKVVDVYEAGDGQGLVLGVWSNLTGTCWYGADLETVPHAIASDPHGVAFEPSGPVGGVANAGFYEAQAPPGSKSCSAASVAAGSVRLSWEPSGA